MDSSEFACTQPTTGSVCTGNGFDCGCRNESGYGDGFVGFGDGSGDVFGRGTGEGLGRGYGSESGSGDGRGYGEGYCRSALC